MKIKKVDDKPMVIHAILSPQNFVRSFTAISLRNMKECRHRESRRKEQKRM